MQENDAPLGNPTVPEGGTTPDAAAENGGTSTDTTTPTPAPQVPISPQQPVPPVPAPSAPSTTAPAPAKAASATPKTAPPATKSAPTAPKTAANQQKTTENVSKTAVSVPVEPGKVLIKLLRSHPAVGAFAGDKTSVSADLAAKLVEGKFAEHTIADPVIELVKPTETQLVQAKAAYSRYGAVTDFKNFQGNPMPEFEKLPEPIQCAWVAVANLEYSHKAA